MVRVTDTGVTEHSVRPNRTSSEHKMDGNPILEFQGSTICNQKQNKDTQHKNYLGPIALQASICINQSSNLREKKSNHKTKSSTNNNTIQIINGWKMSHENVARPI